MKEKLAPTKKGLLNFARRYMYMDVPRSDKRCHIRQRYFGAKELYWYASDYNFRFLYCIQDFSGCAVVLGHRTVDGEEYGIEKRSVDDSIFRRYGLLREVSNA